MKKVINVFLILLSAFFTACSNEDDIVSSDKYTTSKDADFIAFEHITLSGDTYHLNLSEKEANELGISSADYQRIKQDLLATNQAIQENKNTNSTPFQLVDPQNLEFDYFNTNEVKTRGEGDRRPDGTGILSNNEYYTFTIDVPYDCKTINFSMYSNSVVGACSVALYYGGEVYSTGTCMSSAITGAGNCNIKVPMGGTRYQVTVRVSSSFGGTYAYYF